MRKVEALVWVMCLVIVACDPSGSRVKAHERLGEAWVHVPPSPSALVGFKDVPFARVASSKVPKAVSRLINEASVPLSREDARELLGRDIELPPGTSAYLVRGLSVGEGRMPNSVQVLQGVDGSLLVSSNALGGRPEWSKWPHPVIVTLRARPASVWVVANGYD